nr:zinc finger, CCHC-type [Tanacetum cinerariifolium]
MRKTSRKGPKKEQNKKPQLPARGNIKGKRKSKLAYAPKPKIPPPPKKEDPAKDSVCHHYSDTGHWKRNCPLYLSELLKNKKLPQEASTSGFRRSRKLKPGALNLYMVNCQRAAVEAIGSYDLYFPSGLVKVLHNCHYAPSITRGFISVFPFYDDGEGVKSTQWEEMLELLDTVHLSSMVDRWAWTLHGMGSFIVSSAWVLIDNKYLITGGEPINVPTVLCPICGEHSENVSHLFFSCSFVSQVYVLIGRVSERRNKTLLDMVRSMISQTTLLKPFWDYALESAARILNMVPTKK